MEYGNGDINHLVWGKSENKYHHEEDNLSIDNKNVNISVLGKLVKPGSIVLDIGCGEGKIANLLREKNCKLYGIEIDKEAIKYAMSKNRYIDIFNLNIENPEQDIDEFKRFQENRIVFDYLIIADVLEHTVNPTKVIENVSRYLKNNGKILISIPNINNADIVLNLLRGRFNYMEGGILDNTHTKYFTKSSFVEWINEANSVFDDCKYECEYIGGIYGLTDYIMHVKNEMPLVYNFVQLNPEYNIIQNLFVLTKKSKADKTEELEKLLIEKRTDLVSVLSDYLTRGMDEKFLENVRGIRLLPNEREILEERAASAEQGWNQCDAKLAKSQEEIIELNKKNEELLMHLEYEKKQYEETMKGWQKTDKKYQEVLRELKNIDKECKEVLKGWEESDKKCQEAVWGWEKSEQHYQEAKAGWEISEKNYQEAKAGWEISEKNYQEAKAGWEISEKNYQEAKAGWEKSEKNYQEAMAGWRECDSALQELKLYIQNNTKKFKR